MRFRTATAAVFFIALGSLVLGACNKSPSVATSLTTYGIAFDDGGASVPAGSTTFHVKNDATDQSHEFVIVKTDLAEDQLPLDSDGNVDEAQVTKVDEVEAVAPGAAKDLTVNLDPGHYVVFCNLPEHYGKGMHSTLTVK